MMAEATIESIVSSTILEASPSAEPVWGGEARAAHFMYAGESGVGNEYRAYMFFALPFSPGAVITAAALELFGQVSTPGTPVSPVTLVIKRVLDPWDQKITWNTKPAVGPALVTTDLVAADYNNKRFVVDMMPVFNSVLTSEDAYQGWYGIELSITSAGDALAFYGPEAPGAISIYRPSVDIKWVGGIYTPSNLMPSGGQIVSVAKPYLDFQAISSASGEPADLDAINVQISTSSNMSSPWDSGWISTTRSSLDLTTTTYPGVAEGSTVYWRVRQRNTVGQVSDWSATTSFKRIATATVTVTAPADPSAVVPMTITWGTSLPSGVTATSHQVTVRDRDNGLLYYDSGRRTGNPGSITLEPGDIPVVKMKKMATGEQTKDSGPNSFIIEPDLDANGNPIFLQNLNVTVQVWDNQVRPETGTITGVNGDNKLPTNPQSYSIGTKNFVFNTTSVASPVTALAAVNVSPWGSADLTWSRSAVPTEYWISIDGVVVEKITGASARIGSTNNYRFVLNKGLRSRRQQRITVQPKLGTTLLGPASIDFKGRLIAPALSELDGSNAVLILNPDRDEEVANGDGVLEPIGYNDPILIRQSRSSLRRGSLSGILAGEAIPGNTSEADSARYEALRTGQGRALLLRMSNVSLRCFITNAQKVEGVDAEGVFYSISFEYYEVRG